MPVGVLAELAVAESLEDISPEEAYLVGLLHEIAAIPSVLGWPSEGLGSRKSAPLSAMQGSLPLFVLSAIRSMNDSCSSSTWKFILTSAHELAGVETDFDPSTMNSCDPLDGSSRWGALVPAASDCMLAGS